MERILTKIITIFVISLSTYHSIAQGQNLKPFKLSQDSDTAFWYKIYLNNTKSLDLKSPHDSIDFFRISSMYFYVEIIEKKTGSIHFLANEYWENKETNECFSKTYPLSPYQVNSILQLIDSTKIDTIPSRKLIKEWGAGYDGETFYLEHKRGMEYSFKTYWSPELQSQLKEERLIADFIDQIQKITDCLVLKEDFEKSIPFYSWKYPDSSRFTVRKILDYKAYHKYEKNKKKQQRLLNRKEIKNKK